MKAEWREFAVYADAASAEAVAGLLRSEGVPVNLAPDEPLPGLLRSLRVMVPTDQWDRAHALASQAQFSEEELAQFVAEQAAGEDEERSE